MDTRAIRLIRSIRMLTVRIGVSVVVLALSVPASGRPLGEMRSGLAKVTPENFGVSHVGTTPPDTPSLSADEQRECETLLQSIQQQLNAEAASLLAFRSAYAWRAANAKEAALSELLGRWLRTIRYVEDATVQPPLYTTNPPQFRAHLQIELRSRKKVYREVMLTFPLQADLSY